MLQRQREAIRAKQMALKTRLEEKSATKSSRGSARPRGRVGSLSGDVGAYGDGDMQSWGSPSPPASSRGGAGVSAYESSNPDQ